MSSLNFSNALQLNRMPQTRLLFWSQMKVE